MPAVRQVAQVVAVLIHDREPLDSQIRRTGLGDIDDPGVEIPALSGQPLVDLVGHGVGDRAPRLSRAAQLQAHQILLGKHVPKAKLDHEPARVAGHNAAGYQRLRVDDAPVLEARPHCHAAGFDDEGGGIDGAKQARALQIAGDHLGDLASERGVRLIRASEIDERDGQRLHVAARDVHAELGPGAGGGQEDRQEEDDGGREGQGEGSLARNVSTQCQQSSHRVTIVSLNSIRSKRGSRLTPAD